MARKINIMLTIVLGITPSWNKGFLSSTDHFAPKLSELSPVTNIRSVTLLQPDEHGSTRAHQEHLVALTFGRYHKTNRQKYGLDIVPLKKSNSSEPKRQYVWYIEDKLWLEKEANRVKEDTGVYTNSRHGPTIYAKFPQSQLRSFNSSIRMIGVHYWLVTGYT